MSVRDQGRFTPGNSGSEGRYATTQRELAAEIRRRCTSGQDVNQLVTWLWEIAEGDLVETPDGEKIYEGKISDRLTAIKELLDRGYGKAPQVLEVDGTVQHTAAPIDLSNLSDDERAQFRNLVLRAAKPALKA